MPTDLAGGQGLSRGFSLTEFTLSSRLGESSWPRHSDRGQKQGVLHTGISKGIQYNLYFETFTADTLHEQSLKCFESVYQVFSDMMIN